MISQLNLHSFAVFLTLSMGMGYAIFNSSGRYGFWKIALFALFIVPFMYQVFVGGHPIELGLGLFIGWLYARGGISFPQFSIPNSFRSLFQKKPKPTHQSDAQDRPNSPGGGSADQSSHDEKVRQRQEEARQRREQAKQQKTDDSEKQKEQQNQEKPSGNESSQQKPPPKARKPRTDTRTPYQILGVQPGASKAEIKKAYKRTCNRYATDRHQHMSDEFKHEAEEEMKKINAAYNKIK